MVGDTKRDDPFVADLTAQRSGLRVSDMVSLARAPSADKTRLGGDTAKVFLVADPFVCCDTEDGLVDAAGPRIAPTISLTVELFESPRIQGA